MNRGPGFRIILAACAIVAAGPFGPESLDAQSHTFKSGVALVPLTVTVTDRAGHYVPDLTANDFAVFDGGQRQTISHFGSDAVPIDMAVVLDTSSSMRDNLPVARKAACGLVQQLRQGDRAAVAGIGSRVSFPQPMTPDLERVTEALRSTQAHGETALYNALYIVLRQFQQDRQGGTDIRRQVVVLLSDGIDTSSHVTFEDVQDLVRRIQATIYVVSLGDDPVLSRGGPNERKQFESVHALNTLAKESGGRLFTPRTAGELSAIYAAIAEELRHQYLIGYVPSQAADGTFRRISVGVVQPRAGIARTRAGYYAAPTSVGESAASSAGLIVRR